MKISTKGRYGLRAMLDITQNYSGKPVSVKDIAKRQEISEIYLQQIFSILKKAKLVQSFKGSNGGYLLTDTPSKISVKAVLEVLEGELSVTDDKGKKQAGIQAFLYETLLREIDEKVITLMENTTLQKLIDEYNEKGNEISTMYYI